MMNVCRVSFVQIIQKGITFCGENGIPRNLKVKIGISRNLKRKREVCCVISTQWWPEITVSLRSHWFCLKSLSRLMFDMRMRIGWKMSPKKIKIEHWAWRICVFCVVPKARLVHRAVFWCFDSKSLKNWEFYRFFTFGGSIRTALWEARLFLSSLVSFLLSRVLNESGNSIQSRFHDKITPTKLSPVESGNFPKL